jgi:hypothetical protein
MDSSDTTLYDFDPEAAPKHERTITICHVDEDYDVYGGRAKRGACLGETNPPHRGWLGNPFRLSNYGREGCIEKFEPNFIAQLRSSRALCNAVVGLPGRRVACHCRETRETSPACHLDVVQEALLDGRVARIALDIHDIAIPEWMAESACDPEVLL